MAGPDDALRAAADRARARDAAIEAAEQKRRDDVALTEERIHDAVALVRRFLQIMAQHGNPGLEHQQDRKFLGKQCWPFPTEPHPNAPSYPSRPWLAPSGEFAIALNPGPAKWQPMTAHIRAMMFEHGGGGPYGSSVAPGDGEQWRRLVEMRYAALADALALLMVSNGVSPP